MKTRIRFQKVLQIIFIFMICFIALGACKKEDVISVEPDDKDSVITILFIGNSLTYTNDLPSLVTAEGLKNGKSIKTEMVALPNYAIHDHWDEGKVQEMIISNKYDYVIIQQGPSSQAEGRAILLEYGPKYNDLCVANGSKLAYYMVWPALANYNNFDGVIKNYTDAANATNSILCPVGKVWKKYFDETNDLSYYGSDEFHPSLKGSKKAAEVIVESLFK